MIVQSFTLDDDALENGKNGMSRKISSRIIIILLIIIIKHAS